MYIYHSDWSKFVTSRFEFPEVPGLKPEHPVLLCSVGRARIAARPTSPTPPANLVPRAGHPCSVRAYLSIRSPSPRLSRLAPLPNPSSFRPPSPSPSRAPPSPLIRRLWSASSQFLAWEASPPSPRPVPLLIRPSLWPCRPAGERLRPPPLFVVVPPLRCSSPLVPLPVSFASP